ncbi:MAG: polyprenyl synthetase family protein [Chlorobi bacterium]|nr:polyprenyl synthetase family protein [Chlorobiota bacterium]
MFTAKEITVLVNRSIEELTLPDFPPHLYAPIRYILSLGGKRLRPVLSLMSANLFTEDIYKILPTALSIELFHNFTLVHDDIMDEAPLRRKRPSVHKRWDTNIALLSGDALSILAYQKLQESAENLIPRLLKEFNEIALQVCEGQQLDMDYETLKDISLDDYITMIRLKTAALISGAMKTGAIAAGAIDEDIALLYEAGTFLGIAFQIQDDYLDVYGNKETFGKTSGGDILNNKKTFLLVSALEKASGETKRKLDQLLLQPDADPEKKISLIKNIYNRLEIPRETIRAIRDYTEKALSGINKTSVANSRKTPLKDLIQDLLGRQS